MGSQNMASCSDQIKVTICFSLSLIKEKSKLLKKALNSNNSNKNSSLVY